MLVRAKVAARMLMCGWLPGWLIMCSELCLVCCYAASGCFFNFYVSEVFVFLFFSVDSHNKTWNLTSMSFFSYFINAPHVLFYPDPDIQS